MVVTYFESGLGLDLLNHGIRQRLVKLQGQGEVNGCVWHDVERGLADLLEDLHGQLGRNRATGNELVQGVGKSHSDSVKLAELRKKDHGLWVIRHTTSLCKIRSKQ